MTIIPVTYEIELPDGVDAVGGTFLAEINGTAIANIEHPDGTVSAWGSTIQPDGTTPWWHRCPEGFTLIRVRGQGYLHTREYMVIDGRWAKTGE